MKVIAGALGLVIALTLIVAAVAFAQTMPQGANNANGINPTSTDPTTPTAKNPTTSTTPTTAPAADCAGEIKGMNDVLNALPPATRTSLGSSGQLPTIPCAGYHYSADFTIVPDTPPATAPATAPAVPQSQAPTTPAVVPQTQK